MPQKISRSTLLAAGAGIAGAFNIVQAPARAAQYTYKFAHPYPVKNPINVRMNQMADAIKAETNGRLEIQIFPSSILGSQSSMIEQLRLGVIQFFMTGNAQWGTVVPAASIDSIGFAFASQKQPCEALDGPLGAYIRSEFQRRGVFVFDKVCEVGFTQITSSTKPVQVAHDLEGFKIRTPSAPIIVDLFKTLGAEPVSIGAGQMYTAMQTRLVDGSALPLSAVETFKIYEVQKFISISNHMWIGAWITANEKAWEALPSDIQTIVRRNAEKYALQERLDMYSLTDSVTKTLVSQGLTFNNCDAKTMRSALGPYYAHCKSAVGTKAWDLLEASAGKLS